MRVGDESMQDEKKTKKQLTDELQKLRKRIGRLEKDPSSSKGHDKSLGEKLKFLESLVNNASVGLFVLDENVNYVYINPTCGLIMKQRPEDWVGKRAGSFLHPDDREKVSKYFYAVFKGESRHHEARLQAADGQYRNLDVNLVPLKIDKKPYVLGIVTDITDLRKAEKALAESEEQLRLLIDNIPLHISAVDSDLKFMLWNKYAEKMLGYTAEEAIGKLHPKDIIESKEDVKEIRRILSENGICDKQLDYIRKDGTLGRVPLCGGNLDFSHWGHVDITSIKLPCQVH